MTETFTVAAHEQDGENVAAHLVLAPSLTPPDGSVWAWTPDGYVKIVEPWAVESHIGPIDTDERFGDIESWVSYVKAFSSAPDFPPMLTWNSTGLSAVMDYHTCDDLGRCRWKAGYSFTWSPAWLAWSGLVGSALSQREFITFIEDHMPDITTPEPAGLLDILRVLKAHVASQSTTEFDKTGGTSVSFQSTASIRGGVGNEIIIPSEIKIRIPALRGYSEQYESVVKVRPAVTMGDKPLLVFRFAIPQAEALIDSVYAKRIFLARDLLGEDFVLRRAAD